MYEYNCKVRRVVDGDTVDVDIDCGFGIVYANQRIRLYGIDTPESRTRDPIEKYFGKMAGKFLSDKLGEECVLRTHKDKSGKYGRILGQFLVYDGVTDTQMTVNDIMIRDGLAVAYHGQSKDDVEAEHLSNRVVLSERLNVDPSDPEVNPYI